MVCTAEVWLAFFLTLSIWGTARAIRMSMMDMTMSSSMRVKPNSRDEVRGSGWVVIAVVFMVPLERNGLFCSATNCNSVRFNMRELCGRPQGCRGCRGRQVGSSQGGRDRGRGVG